VRVAQLHGDGARAALGTLPAELAAIWVLHAAPDGSVQSALPPPPETVGGRWAGKHVVFCSWVLSMWR
jgi:hypothetical protein